MHMSLEKFKAKVCTCCGQTEEYLMTIDAGTCDIVRAMSAAIRKKGENIIHPRREMELGKNQLDYKQMIKEGYLTSTMVGNLSKARSQGLIAQIEGKSGYYCLTRKGAEFLRGASIPKYAVMSKITGHQIGYWHENEERVKLKDLIKSGDYWEIDFNIIDRRIVMNIPQPATLFNY